MRQETGRATEKPSQKQQGAGSSAVERWPYKPDVCHVPKPGQALERQNAAKSVTDCRRASALGAPGGDPSPAPPALTGVAFDGVSWSYPQPHDAAWQAAWLAAAGDE